MQCNRCDVIETNRRIAGLFRCYSFAAAAAAISLSSPLLMLLVLLLTDALLLLVLLIPNYDELMDAQSSTDQRYCFAVHCRYIASTDQTPQSHWC